MVQAILKMFFEVREENKCITVVKKRESNYLDRKAVKKEERMPASKTFEETCLSEHFRNIKGLNVKERAFYSARRNITALRSR